jgi:hemerythrin-like domain-containing protein
MLYSKIGKKEVAEEYTKKIDELKKKYGLEW